MDFIQTPLMWVFGALAVTSVALTFYNERSNLWFIWEVWKRFRIGMFFQAFGVILITITIGILLMNVPGLSFGWLSLVFDGGGNIFIRPVQEVSKSSIEIFQWVPLLFFIAFLLAIPFLAKYEEDSFRKGHEEWGGILKQSIYFGLVHCLVGIPIAFGIALIVSGLFYGYHYKRAFEQNLDELGYIWAQDEAAMVSTTYHAMYNTIVISIVIIATFLIAI